MSEERWETLRSILQRTPFDDANLPADQTHADGRVLCSLANDFIAAHERPERELAQAIWRTSIHALAISLGAAALAICVYLVVFRERLRPNLAEHASWKTSSRLAICDPVHVSCAGAVTAILFHTIDEESPWVEFDLGERKPFTRVDVRNRIDCCQDRAVPLVIEVSDDETSWVEVARQDQPFVNWTARVRTTRARYVRLRVPRRTYFHLEAIEIR